MLVLRGGEAWKSRADRRFVRQKSEIRAPPAASGKKNREKRVRARQIFSMEKMTRI